MTRPDLDRWALRSHELAIEATDDGRLPEEIVPVTVKCKKGDTVVEVDEGPRRDTLARGARQAARARRQGGLAHRRQLPRRQRRRRRARARLRRVGAGQRQGGAGRDRRARAERQRLRLPGHARRPAPRKKALEKAGLKAERHRPLGDQRGVRLGHPELDPPARHRRGQGQRQRRRGRARPPDRRLRRAHPRRARARAAPPRRRPRLRGDLLGRRPGRRRDPARQRRLMPSRTRALTRPPPSSTSTAR